MKKPFVRKFLSLTGLLILLGFVSQMFAQNITPDMYSSLRYRHIGPPGNRTSAVAGVPGDPMVYYVGAASGGIWKSIDGGLNFSSIFDGHDVQSIGAIAVAPSDPNVVWTGTGEAFIRSNVSIGNGVYKSTDAGKTWEHMGLEHSGRVGRVVIHPTNPDIVLVGALGHCYGPQKERGVYKTTDGGKTWKHVLFADEDTGCFEIAMDPSNSNIMFAGMWPLEIHTYGRESGGPKGGVYKSIDGGNTWKHLKGNGLPDAPLGKVGIAIANSNPNVVYALIETGYPNRGVLWRSNNKGESWRCVSYNRILNERSHYASRIMVNSGDEDEVYFAANSHSITKDGGYSSETTGWSGDSHDMWIDPTDPDRFMISDDGGVKITENHGRSWNRVNLPIAQMYHVAVDNQIPYYVYGGKQDGSGYKGPSNASGRGSSNEWESTAGCECGFIVPDPVNPNIVWGGCYTAGFTKVDYSTGHERTVKVWPESTYGASAGEHKFRFNWTFPITISPHNHNKIYVGSQYVHVTTNGGESWEIISPDLSTNDMSRMGPSGGLTKDNIGVENACLVFAIEESPLEEGVIYAGTNDGLLHVTHNGGETWTNITKNIPELPEWGTISNIEASKYDAGTAYLTVDFHQMNNRDPYIYKTTNYGHTWKSIVADLPVSVFSYCHWIHEDPVRKGLLYLGTENAIYVSFNDGGNWMPIQNNLPHAPVHHMVIQEHFNDLVIGTYGRGFWIMDDITPLQQLTDNVLRSDAHLFVPRAAYRMHRIKGGPGVNSRANINYYLKNTPKGGVKISILDSDGNLVNTVRGSSNPGINRASWDLKMDRPMQAKLRTRPPGNPTVVDEKRYAERWDSEGWYPVQSWGTSGGFSGITVSPGEYTIKLEVEGKVFTQKLEIRKDPKSAGTLDDIKEQVNLQLKIKEDIITTAKMLNQCEWMKKQLIDFKEVLATANRKSNKPVYVAAEKLQKEIQAVEDKIFEPTIADGDTKSFRFANKLYSKLSVLGGDLASSVDFAPNKQQKDVYKVLHDRMVSYKSELDQLINNNVKGFNDLLKEMNIPGGIIPVSN
ncbi:sialidase [Bacteroidota bacterium]